MMIKNKMLATQFRFAFVGIILTSFVATIIVGLSVTVLLFNTVFKEVQPANYYEQEVEDLVPFLKSQNQDLLSSKGEAILQTKFKEDLQSGSNALLYQVVDKDNKIIYGNNPQAVFTDKADMVNNVNNTFYRGDYYTEAVPIIDNDGNIAGAVALSYKLEMTNPDGSPAFPWGSTTAILIFDFALPFVFIILFTYIFSKRLAKNVNRPLNLLMEAVENIKAKNLDFNIDYHADNEMGKLCNAFREMQTALKASLTTQWKMEQEKSEMTEALAHDLKTPLSVIQSYTEAIVDSPSIINDKTKLLKYVDTIKRNAEKSSSLVRQMQYTATMENLNNGMVSEQIDIRNFIGQIVNHYELSTKQKQIKLEANVTDNVPKLIFVNKAKLERILDNILANSLAYTPKNGVIEIIVDYKANFIQYIISDSGKGFSDKDKQNAFAKFYRGDEARSLQGEIHSGLGLYIVKQLVTQLAGTIELATSSLGGAQISISLPLKK